MVRNDLMFRVINDRNDSNVSWTSMGYFGSGFDDYHTLTYSTCVGVHASRTYDSLENVATQL